MNTNDFEFIQKFLKINQPMEGETPCRYSMMALLLRNARKLAGRNIETGVYEMNEVNENNFVEQTYYSMQYTSLINYLILLEQIGSIFKPKGIDKIEQTNGITKSRKNRSNQSFKK